MVSQPEHSTSLALRGASSAVGSRHSHSHSHSRARRYNRSHAGGTSYVPQNEFPIYSTSGDVEILVKVPSGHENRYLLHRQILTHCSGFFEASTSNEWSRAQPLPETTTSSSSPPSLLPPPPHPSNALTAGSELARIGEDGGSERGGSGGGGGARLLAAGSSPRRRWRYELDPGTGDGDIPMLVQKDENSSGGSPPSSSSNTLSPPNNSLFGSGSHSASVAQKGGGHKSSSSSSSRTVAASNSSFFRSVANLSLSHHHHHHHHNQYEPPPLPPPSQADQDLLRDYDNLFRIMYNYPPVLDGINIADAYVQCKSLLTLADQYDALAVVGPRVDHHLLQFQSRLWKQIAKYPISYLRLGYLARSKIIFQEALIHVVGQWPAGERSLRAALPDAVLDIIEDKVDELEETVARVEGRLFRLGLTTRAGDRVTPGTAYLDWLAVSLFRQWLADNTTPIVPQQPPPLVVVPDRRRSNNNNNNNAAAPATRGGSSSSSSAGGGIPPPPGGVGGAGNPPLASLGRTYRTLGAAAPGLYLGHDECKRFLKLAGELYSRDNLRRFEKRIDELKAMAREVVRPLMGSGLELEMAGPSAAAAVGYLTCTRVGDRDLPWAVDD